MIVAAFLRGMNLGNRRITNAELRAQFERLGFASVATFQAAGNVVFEAGEASEGELIATIERGLEEGLGYAVPTLLRSEDELRAIAAAEPFPAGEVSASKGKLQVLLSDDLTGESRAMIYRDIRARVRQAAPFLRFDRDPYIVVTEDGRLMWMIDGYTTTDRYPYADPVRGWAITSATR